MPHAAINALLTGGQTTPLLDGTASTGAKEGTGPDRVRSARDGSANFPIGTNQSGLFVIPPWLHPARRGQKMPNRTGRIFLGNDTHALALVHTLPIPIPFSGGPLHRSRQVGPRCRI